MGDSTFSPKAVAEAVRQCLPAAKGAVALSEPLFGGNEWRYLKDCLDTGWVSSTGAYVDRLEAMLRDVTGARFAVATVNGTAALHVALLLAGVTAGDEVLTPTLTFVATTNAITYCGAAPHFVDSDYETLGVDPVRLEEYLVRATELRQGACINRSTGRTIRALIVMHAFGHPVDLDRLAAVCERHGLWLIEDAAEALGSYYKERHVGQDGLLGILSFNGNKIVTTGGGGAVLSNDERLARDAKHLTTTAKLPHPWRFDHDRVGYNYRLPNINAALGCAQLEQLPGFLDAKRRLADRYCRMLADVPGIRFVREPNDARSNYWLNAILLDEQYAFRRDECLLVLHREGLLARPAWTLQHRLPMFTGAPAMSLMVAEDIESRLINLPSSVVLGA